jgi:uncharacterized membrane protein
LGNEESIPMRKTIAKAVTWRLIGTAEIFAISFWTTGHIVTAGHMAGITAVTSIIMYVAHELAWGANTGNPAGSIRTGDAPITRAMDHGPGISTGDTNGGLTVSGLG